jgi:two-component system nitrate/nitrite response regulator NarL
MNSIINIYCKEKIIIDWFNKVKEDLDRVYNFNFHSNLNSLKNELEIKMNISIVIIDIENEKYSLFTKAYFNQHENIKFIGVGYKKGIVQIINLIENNIFSYISLDDNGLGLVKAINSAIKGKPYFCDETKDYLIDSYISSMNPKNKKYFVTGEDKTPNSNNLEIVKELTVKEKKVSNLLSQGLSYKEIASVMGVTTFAINQNAKSIFKKLNVRSRSELSYRMLN